MYKRLLISILLGFAVLGSAAAQDSRGFDENLRLKGVLISDVSRTALINGRPFRKGDHVGGAEILAIEQRGIRVLVGARELSVNVGGTFEAGPSRARVAPNINAGLQHAVRSGETLSGIAFQYRKDGVTINQMMIALYQSNPQAFSHNINLLHEGAVLRIPGEDELHRQTPAMAAAEVARHSESWREPRHQRVRVADTSDSVTYGPVESGETLSAIASRVSRDGMSMDQMMIALYQSNPQAFSGNINVLHEGAILQIPGENELVRQTPETATAEVARQTKAWRAGFEQHAQSPVDHTSIMASTDSLLE